MVGFTDANFGELVPAQSGSPITAQSVPQNRTSESTTLPHR